MKNQVFTMVIKREVLVTNYKDVSKEEIEKEVIRMNKDRVISMAGTKLKIEFMEKSEITLEEAK